MLVDAGMIRRLPADVLMACFTRAKQVVGHGVVSFGGTCALNRPEFAEAILRLGWALFLDTHLSDSIPTLLDEILGKETMFPPTSSYSRVREFSLNPTYSKILLNYEGPLMDHFMDHSNEATDGYLMTANTLVDYMKERNMVNVQVTERFVRLKFCPNDGTSSTFRIYTAPRQ